MLTVLSVHGVYGAKILLVPVQHRSNIREMALLSEDLILNGHLVFIIIGSSFNGLDELFDLDIRVLSFHVSKHDPMLYSQEVENDLTDSVFRHKSNEYIETTVSEIGFHGCEVLMRDQSLLDSLRSIRFDIAIVDAYPFAPCSAIVPHYLGVPFITKDASPLAVHQPIFPSFIPYSSIHYSHTVYFFERIGNTISLILDLYGYAHPDDVQLLTKYSACLTDWNELLRQGLLHITTKDHLLSSPMPVLASHIQLPGVTWRSARPLTNPIFRFMDLAPDGAVVVSFGSNVNSLPTEYLGKLFTAFERFSSLVFIMKLDQQVTHSIKVPRNVLQLPWLPLNDLLGHPRTRLFISHCGKAVMHEAIYHGVPILALPLFQEDRANAENLVHRGLGLYLNIFKLTPQKLEDMLNELLKNKKYNENAEHISGMLKNQKFNPTETIAFWVEHVLKFGGNHLRSEAMNMTSTQFIMLDIAMAFFTLFAFLFWFAYAYTKFLVHIIWKPKKKKKYCDRC